MVSNKDRFKLEKYYELILEDQQMDMGKMKEDAEELLRYSYQCNDSYGQAFAFIYLAIYYLSVRKLDAAWFNLEKAKPLCCQNGFQRLLLFCYRYEGTVCQLRGDKIKAIRIYGKAMNLAENQKEETIIGVLYNNIAVILMDYKDMELAEEYFRSAANQFLEIPEQKDSLVQIYTNLVQACCALQDVAGAQYYLQKAKSICGNTEKAMSSITAGEARLSAEERDVKKVTAAAEQYLQLLNNSKGGNAAFAADGLTVAESLLIVELNEECHDLLKLLLKVLERTDLQMKLQLYKLYIRYEKASGRESIHIYEKYYKLLMRSEEQEYSSLAESLHGRIKLFEMNQKQSELKKENETLQKQAHLDELTGTFNRGYFDQFLEKIRSDPKVQRIGCVMLDIDHFKKYNDSYGHFQGDQILIQVANTLMKNRILGIYVGRFGGDEFYCLCTNLLDEQIEQYLQAVYKDLKEQRIEHCMNQGKIVTLSAGFYNEAKTEMDFNKILDCADRALYAAKDRGRNGFVKFQVE